MTTTTTPDDRWLAATMETLAGYRRMIDAAVAQLDDEALVRRPAPGMNSVAVLLRHLGGNLQGRWDAFLTTDGEKPSRDRDAEFDDWPGDRDSLLAYFDTGWRMLTETLAALTPEDLTRTVTIRGETHAVPFAIMRSVTHIASHVGQLVMIARLVHGDDTTWKWLTIPPGGSARHNTETWGTPSSRAVFGA